MTFEVTIPVLNEAETLQRQVSIIHAFLKKHFSQNHHWEIAIADNGSTDGTLDLADQLSVDFPEIRVVSTGKRGVGLALKTAWQSSTAEVVGYMDLDLATDLNHFLEVIQIFEKGEVDLLYATRLHPFSKVINRPLKREITSRIFNYILKAYLRTNFSDGMCGFKFLKKENLDTLIENGAISDGWFFSTELLAVGEWQGLKTYELPVTWTDDISSSKVKVFELAKEYLEAMRVLKERR